MSDGRRRRRAVALLCILPAAAALLSSNALAQTASIKVTIRTVPAVAGVRFRLDGQRAISNADGVVQASVAGPGTYWLKVAAPAKVGLRKRIDRVRWSDGTTAPRRTITLTSDARMSIGLSLSYLVRERYTDADGDTIDPRIIDSVVISDDTGSTQSFPGYLFGVRGPTARRFERHPPGTRWLPATRITADGGLASHRIAYRAQSIVAHGASLGASSEEWTPDLEEPWPIEAEGHVTEVGARDALLGSHLAAPVSVQLPDGRRLSVGPGTERLLLPSGSYVARAESGGLALSATSEVPPADAIRPPVITVLDLFVVTIVAAGAVLALRRVASKRAAATAREAAAVPEGQRAGGQATPTAQHEPQPLGDAMGRYVRVLLRDGRAIEGWTTSSLDAEVLLMRVMHVQDGEGRAVASTPLDSFLATSRIALLEELETPDAARWRAGSPPAGFGPSPDEAGVARAEPNSSPAQAATRAETNSPPAQAGRPAADTETARESAGSEVESSRPAPQLHVVHDEPGGSERPDDPGRRSAS